MSADWWARGIAIGGAAAASFNMVTSYLTYRKVKPRFSIEVDDERSDHDSLSLKISNKSSTLVLIKRVELRRVWKIPGLAYLYAKPLRAGLHEFFEPLKIEPLNGTKINLSMREWTSSRDSTVRLVRGDVLVVLNDGKKVRTRVEII